MHLSFLNANWLRKYPFKASSSLSTDNGLVMPNDIIVGVRLMTNSSNLQIKVSKVVIKGGVISIEFGNGTDTHDPVRILGTAIGKAMQDNQVLKVTSVLPAFSGFVVIGNPDRLKEDATYIFNSDNGTLEPSTFTVFTPPPISHLQHHGAKLAGNVAIEVTGLDMGVSGNSISLSVIAPNDVASRKDRTSTLLTCTNPIISGINSVKPNSDNEIDIYGVAPVRVTVSGPNIVIDTEKTVTDVCQPVNIPPTDNTDVYHGDATTVDDPEWKNWPQFNA
jgi:hypothetical protein